MASRTTSPILELQALRMIVETTLMVLTKNPDGSPNGFIDVVAAAVDANPAPHLALDGADGTSIEVAEVKERASEIVGFIQRMASGRPRN